MLLQQLREQRAEFLCKTGAAGAAAKQFQFIRVPQQQGAQHHEATLGGQKFWRRDLEVFKDKLRQPVEGKDLQAREAGDFTIVEQLAFKLKRRLLGREKNQG